MKIKRLEIAGFKSFVDKAVFDFQQGITAIVGPNGCGKSNVVDAMRWAMGEQSAKNLRGRQMEDVIFGGSESRRPVGMAEVSLVFSTEDGRVPAKYLSFSEIQVTRRLYRDGESEYLLNKTPCRLMDISELFMDTGIGAKAYSVIEQGRIGTILHAKPEERRFLIEEAAGVTKYKVRKQVALKKIDITRQNLMRLADIIGEIRRQLGSLQRQAKKAESFKSIREEMRGLELVVARQEFQALEGEIGVVAGVIQKHEEKSAVLLAESSRLEMVLEQSRCDVVNGEQALAEAQERFYVLRTEIQGDENRVELMTREIEGLKRQTERGGAESLAIAESHTAAMDEISRLREVAASVEAECVSIGDELRQADEQVAILVEEELKSSRSLDACRAEFFGATNRVAEVANRTAMATRRLESLQGASERQLREFEALKVSLAAAVAAREVAEQQHVEAVMVRDQKNVALDGARREEEELRSRADELARAVQVVREQLSAKSSRLESLRELEAQFVGYGQGTKTILSSPGFKERFSCVLADVVETDPVWEQAVEAAFSERVQYLLCQGTSNSALEAADYLKTEKGGRCGFIVERPAPLVLAASVDCTCLTDVVKIVPGFEPLVRPLLSSVYVVDDLKSAIVFAQKHPGMSFVTRDGELVAADGTISCGSFSGAGDGLIHKKQEIRQLDKQVKFLQDQASKQEAALHDCLDRAASKAQMVGQLSKDLHHADLQAVTLEKDMARLGQECARIEELQHLREVEGAQLDAERQQLHNELDGLAQQEKEYAGIAATTEKFMHESVISLDELRCRLTDAREKQTALKVRAASLTEKRDSSAQAMTRLQSQLDELGRREALSRGETERALAAMSALEDSIRVERTALGEKSQKMVLAEAHLQELKAGWDNSSAKVREQEGLLRQLRNDYDVLVRHLAEDRLRLAELTLKRDHLVDVLQERHHISSEELDPMACDWDGNVEDIQQRLAVLRRQLDDLGEVNLAALEDYRQLDERHGFLVGQKADLEESLQSLQKAIGKINRTTRQRFMETFTLVNERFKEVFPRLFCGGSAELRLTDEEDLLETGIDIVVQPPGKKLQNVTLLSGGEKALTAVALIFSIFQIKPSPFCLLDEVDAPLDEANIGRFNELVREMSRFSQFIAITHSKATMAVADTLYGITMEEPGVSKVVSVRLNKESEG